MIESFGAMGVMLVVFLALAIPVVAVWLVAHVVGFVFGVVGAVVGLVFGIVARVLGLASRTAGRAGGFVRTEARELVHLAGGVLTAGVLLPLALTNLVLGRRRAAIHYGRALEDEAKSAGLSLYRVSLGNPLRFMGLGAVTEGVERRLPELVARVPAERRAASPPAFAGYVVTGTLPAGGSGARLFLARPREATVRRYRAAGHPDPGQVVVKSFALHHGSTLPQIVRESRALEAARRLGLVLDHELTDGSFWYAMPFVPGDDLDVVTRRLHARSPAAGLERAATMKVIGYASDLLATLERFHAGGLWHKDIKPSNLIVSGDRVHLVDLGLVTPLASAMTLTTHGTEYFRDPELVRLAMRGVKVHEVDGVKFDVYSAGAVVYSMIENSFPAHGSLSRITRACPDGLAWIVRRAMAEIDQRYASAREMRRDLEVLLAADDPWAVRPADLPSMGGAAAAAAFASAPEPAAPEPLPDELAATPPTAAPSGRRRVAGRRRGGLRKALTAAAFVAVFAGIFGAMVRARGHHHASWVDAPQALGARLPRLALQWPEPETRTATVIRTPRRATITLDELSRTAAAPRDREPAVLLLLDLALEDDAAPIRGLVSALDDGGFRVLGHGGPDDEASIDLLAGARRAVELDDLDDPDAHARLQTYLDGSRELDAIVWLAPGGAEDSVEQKVLVRSANAR